jgi:hypothetical protein
MPEPGTTQTTEKTPVAEETATEPAQTDTPPETPPAAPVVAKESEEPAKADEVPPTAPVDPVEDSPATDEPEKPEETPQAAQADDKTKALETRLRAALIAAHNVAPELQALLPQDVDALEAFLESPEYKALGEKLSKETLPPPTVQDKAPEPPPKTSEQDSRAALTRIGLSLTGG